MMNVWRIGTGIIFCLFAFIVRECTNQQCIRSVISNLLFKLFACNHLITTILLRSNSNKQRNEKKFFQAVVNAVLFFRDMSNAFSMSAITMRTEKNIIHVA